VNAISLTSDEGVYTRLLNWNCDYSQDPDLVSTLKGKIADSHSDVYLRLILFCPLPFTQIWTLAQIWIEFLVLTIWGRSTRFCGFWMSFVTWTRFHRQKTKYTTPAAKPACTTTAESSSYISRMFSVNTQFPCVPVKVKSPFTSRREINIDVCKYIWIHRHGAGRILKRTFFLSWLRVKYPR